jgi:hypothetical protein
MREKLSLCQKQNEACGETGGNRRINLAAAQAYQLIGGEISALNENNQWRWLIGAASASAACRKHGGSNVNNGVISIYQWQRISVMLYQSKKK